MFVHCVCNSHTDPMHNQFTCLSSSTQWPRLNWIFHTYRTLRGYWISVANIPYRQYSIAVSFQPKSCTSSSHETQYSICYNCTQPTCGPIDEGITFNRTHGNVCEFRCSEWRLRIRGQAGIFAPPCMAHFGCVLDVLCNCLVRVRPAMRIVCQIYIEMVFV